MPRSACSPDVTSTGRPHHSIERARQAWQRERRAARAQLEVTVPQADQHGRSHLERVESLAGQLEDRRREIAERIHTDVDADTEHDCVGLAAGEGRLGRDAREFAPAAQHVVGPLEARLDAELEERLGHGQARDQRHQRTRIG
jgi:hypothetical protein